MALLRDDPPADHEWPIDQRSLLEPSQFATENMDNIFHYPTTASTGMFGGFQILLNTAIGSGALMVPYCFSVGIAMELIISLAFASLAWLSMHFLIEAARVAHKYDYQGLFDFCWGEKKRWILDLFIALTQFGALMIYAHWNGRLVGMVVGSLVPNLPNLLKQHSPWIFFIVAVVVFPLTFFRNIGKLDIVSFFSTFFVCVLIIHGLYELIRDVTGSGIPGYTWDGAGKREAFDFADGHWKVVITAFGVNALAFTCHINMFSVYEQLERPTVARVRRLGLIVFGAAFLLYNSFGLITYIDRPDDLYHSSTALDLYFQDRGGRKVDPFAVVATLGVVVLLVGSSPVVLWALRNSVHHLIWGEKSPTQLRWIVLGGLLVFGPAFFASLSDDVVTYFDLVGGLVTPVITFFFPGLFYLKVVKKGPRWMKYLAGQHLVFTVVGAAASTYQVIDKLVH
jgi:amino acid permease